MIEQTHLAPNYVRRLAGHRAQARGRAFENALDRMHVWYARTGRAIIEQANVPTVPVGGKGLRKIRGKAPIDFAGHIRGGRAIYIEAKATAEAAPSLGFGRADAGVDAEQVARLQLRLETGALCVVLWLNGDRVGVLGPHALNNAVMVFQHGGRKSVTRDEFVWTEDGSFDWLPIIEAEVKRGA